MSLASPKPARRLSGLGLTEETVNRLDSEGKMSQTSASDEKNLSTRSSSCASLVIEHHVSKGKETEFQRWQDSLNSAVNSFPGYLRTDLSSPVTNAQEKWYVIVYFDTRENLERWVNSTERQALVKKGEELFGTYQYRSFKTGLESWFTSESDEFQVKTPAWKQNLIVLLGLYPTVMLQTIFLSAFDGMNAWPLSVSMLVNNFVCCSVLTWVVIPPLSRWFQFWLKEYPNTSSLVDLRGLGIILVLLLVLMGIFYVTSDSDLLTVYRSLQSTYRYFFS